MLFPFLKPCTCISLNKILFLKEKKKQTVLVLTSLIGVIDTGIALFVAYRWLEQMNLGWYQMHLLKMIWLTIFLTWLMRQASPTGRDLGVKVFCCYCALQIFGHGGRMQGYGTDTEKSILPTLLFLQFWSFVPLLKINFPCLPFVVLKFATVLDHIFLLFICSNLYYYN